MFLRTLVRSAAVSLLYQTAPSPTFVQNPCTMNTTSLPERNWLLQKKHMSIRERMPAKLYHQFAKTLVFVKTVHRHERSRWAPTKVLRVMSRVEKGVSGGKSVEDEY